MDLQFTQEELDFQSEVRDWINENYSDDMRERHDNSPNGHLSREEHMQWQQALYKQGWAGVNWPKEYGGAEFVLVRQPIVGSGFAVALQFTDSASETCSPYSLKGFSLEFAAAGRR